MISATTARVLSTQDLGRGNFLLELEAPEVAAESTPGQFVMAWVEDSLSLPFPLLRKALAIYSLPGSGKETITLALKVVGDGTARLASAQPGSVIGLIGPLGNGFDTQQASGKTAVIVAGGIGIASVYLLAKDLVESGRRVHLIYGGREARDLVLLEDFQRLGVTHTLTTEDGSRGIRGRVTQGLEKFLEGHSGGEVILYTCGPTPMMQAVAGMAASERIHCQISVEVKMACGFGVCLGCTVKTSHAYRLACTHGPVFDAADFIWESA